MRLLNILTLVCFFSVASQAQETHRFFDTQNKILFTGVAVSRTLDMHSTWQARRQGLQEAYLSNELVDNKKKFTGFSYGMAGASIALSYAFHKKGWHKAERILSYVHIGTVGYTAGHNYYLSYWQ